MTTAIPADRGVSRRVVLFGCVAGGATALATGASALQMSPVKVSKDCVHYLATAQGGHRCSACKLYVAPSACIAVAGEIRPDCGCRIWLSKTV